MKPTSTYYHNKNITKAIVFAAEAHHLQYRKGSAIPYIFHPINVGRILIENDCLEPVIIAGILHDVIEDTDVTPEIIKANFGEKVLGYVLEVTEPNKKDPWKTRKKQYIENANKISIRALQIMCADKLDNLSQIKRDIDKYGERVWERFNAPKDQIKWYYSSLTGIFMERFRGIDEINLVYKLKKLIGEVFHEQKV